MLLLLLLTAALGSLASSKLDSQNSGLHQPLQGDLIVLAYLKG